MCQGNVVLVRFSAVPRIQPRAIEYAAIQLFVSNFVCPFHELVSLHELHKGPSAIPRYTDSGREKLRCYHTSFLQEFADDYILTRIDGNFECQGMVRVINDETVHVHVSTACQENRCVSGLPEVCSNTSGFAPTLGFRGQPLERND